MEGLSSLQNLPFQMLAGVTASSPQSQQEAVVGRWIETNFSPSRLRRMSIRQLNYLLDGCPQGLLQELTVVWISHRGLLLEKRFLV
jgi:hypothetical protein